MYEKQTARLNYCEIHEQISSKTQMNSSKTVFKKYAQKIKNGFLNNFEKTAVISLKQINITVIIKRKLVSVLF